MISMKLDRLWNLKVGEVFRFQGECVEWRLTVTMDEVGCVGIEQVKDEDRYEEVPGCYDVLVKR